LGFEGCPGNNVLVMANAPQFTILAATENYLQITGKIKRELIGRGVFEAFPPITNDSNDAPGDNLLASFEEVIAEKKIHQLPVQRYDLPNEDGNFVERFWRISNSPVIDEEGIVAYIISSTDDITKEVKAQQREQQIKLLEQAHNLFMQAPVAIHIFKGPDLLIELANQPTLELWGREERVVGKPFFEVMPELKGQGLKELMHEVMQTGQSKELYETPLALKRAGKEDIGYFNFVYQPYYEEDRNAAAGVLIFATEVTGQVLARKKILQSEQKFRNVVEQSDFAICILKGNDLIIEVANKPLLQIWDKGPEVIGQPVQDVIPEAEEQGFLGLLYDVYNNGKTHHGYEAPAIMRRSRGESVTLYFDFVYQPYREADGSVSGVLVLANDITERVHTKQELAKKERSLRESADKFSNLLEALPQMTWTNLPTGEVNFCNKQWLNYTGIDFEQTKGWGWKTLVHPEDLPRTLKDFNEALVTGNILVTENRYKRVDGEYRWHLNRALPIKNEVC
jgi:PAS domain S-box-containing protein